MTDADIVEVSGHDPAMVEEAVRRATGAFADTFVEEREPLAAGAPTVP